MSDTQPLITLIVTFYNEEAYLDSCLASVASQNYPNLEVLLMDDASTDASPEIARRHAAEDARMQLHRMEHNGGIARLRNRALDLAQGDYIAWIDGDDWIDPHHVSTLYDALRQAPTQPAIVLCPTQRHNADGSIKDWRGMRVPDLTTLSSQEALTLMMTGDKVSGHFWNKLFPRELFDNERMPEGRVFEDYYLLPRLVARATCLICTDHTLYHYRLHATSIVHVAKPQNVYDLTLACRDRILFLRNDPPRLAPEVARRLEVYPLKTIYRAYHRLTHMDHPERHAYLAKMEEAMQDLGLKPLRGIRYSSYMFLLSLLKRYTEWWLRRVERHEPVL